MCVCVCVCVCVLYVNGNVFFFEYLLGIYLGVFLRFTFLLIHAMSQYDWLSVKNQSFVLGNEGLRVS